MKSESSLYVGFLPSEGVFRFTSTELKNEYEMDGGGGKLGTLGEGRPGRGGGEGGES